MGTCLIPLSNFIGKDIVDEWYPLQQRPNKREIVSGDIRLKIFLAVCFFIFHVAKLLE